MNKALVIEPRLPAPRWRQWWPRLWAAGDGVRTVALPLPEPCGRVSAQYLSFAIDISVLAGGNWWEGSLKTHRGLGARRVAPLDLEAPKLNALVSALGPAYLRIGGSEADHIHYLEPDPADPQSLVLTAAIWDALHAFKTRHGLQLMFTVKYGLTRRSLHGHWSAAEFHRLAAHSRARGQTVEVLELGNELNAYWAFHGLASQPRARRLAEDYRRFAAAAAEAFPGVRLQGPGSAFWPRLGEAVKPFTNLTGPFLARCARMGTPLHIIDWHYYPYQSRRAPVRTRRATAARMLSPRALDDFGRFAARLKHYRDTFYPNAELWTGETGSAQCGGEPGLSDRFASCFWWADQLGQGALCGQQVMVRQSLIGGDYGLIDRVKLRPRPDYWLSWLWQQLMGTSVLRVTSPHRRVRAYCHTHPGGGHTLLLINLSRTPVTIDVSTWGAGGAHYTLTAKRLDSRKVRINGRRAKFRKGRVTLEDFATEAAPGPLPGTAIRFCHFPAGVPAAGVPAAGVPTATSPTAQSAPRALPPGGAP